MFAAAHKAAKALISKSGISKDDDLILPTQCLPKGFSLSQLQDELVTQKGHQTKEDELENLLILSACLGGPTRLQIEDDDDQEHITQISTWVSKLILPDGSIVASDESPEDATEASREAALLRTRRKGSLGLKILKDINSLYPNSVSSADSNQLSLAKLAFSSPDDPWTTLSALSNSQALLSAQLFRLQTPEFITTYLLQTIIRPLFSKSTPSTITSSSRKAMPTSAPLKPHDFSASRSKKLWKYNAPYSITVLQWAVENASPETISQSWHLITPPVLTLLDEISTPHRLRGLQILSSFLPNLTSKLLAQTGLGEVFEDAVMPTLLYLPSITPLEESIQLLPAAYNALFALSSIRYTLPFDTSTNSSPKPLASLTRLLRHGILSSYSHCSSYPQITQILLHQLRLIIHKMGINSVAHLKDILPILSATLMDPFVTVRLELLLEALGALKEVVLNAWPRIGEEGHRREVVRMLVVCWGSVREAVEEKKGEELERVKGEMREAGRLFVKAIEGKVNVKEELIPLIQIDESLRELFGIVVDD